MPSWTEDLGANNMVEETFGYCLEEFDSDLSSSSADSSSPTSNTSSSTSTRTRTGRHVDRKKNASTDTESNTNTNATTPKESISSPEEDKEPTNSTHSSTSWSSKSDTVEVTKLPVEDASSTCTSACTCATEQVKVRTSRATPRPRESAEACTPSTSKRTRRSRPRGTYTTKERHWRHEFDSLPKDRDDASSSSSSSSSYSISSEDASIESSDSDGEDSFRSSDSSEYGSDCELQNLRKNSKNTNKSRGRRQGDDDDEYQDFLYHPNHHDDDSFTECTSDSYLFDQLSTIWEEHSGMLDSDGDFVENDHSYSAHYDLHLDSDVPPTPPVRSRHSRSLSPPADDSRTERIPKGVSWENSDEDEDLREEEQGDCVDLSFKLEKSTRQQWMDFFYRNKEPLNEHTYRNRSQDKPPTLPHGSPRSNSRQRPRKANPSPSSSSLFSRIGNPMHTLPADPRQMTETAKLSLGKLLHDKELRERERFKVEEETGNIASPSSHQHTIDRTSHHHRNDHSERMTLVNLETGQVLEDDDNSEYTFLSCTTEDAASRRSSLRSLITVSGSLHELGVLEDEEAVTVSEIIEGDDILEDNETTILKRTVPNKDIGFLSLLDDGADQGYPEEGTLSYPLNLASIPEDGERDTAIPLSSAPSSTIVPMAQTASVPSGETRKRLRFELARKLCQESLEQHLHDKGETEEHPSSSVFMDPVQRQLNYQHYKRMIQDSLLQRYPHGNNERMKRSRIIFSPIHRKLSFSLNRQVVKRSLQAVPKESSASAKNSDRHMAWKTRLKLERYGGQRRRNAYQRSKKLLQQRVWALDQFSTRRGVTRSMSSEERRQKLAVEQQERFGGLRRTRSYRESRQALTHNMDKLLEEDSDHGDGGGGLFWPMTSPPMCRHFKAGQAGMTRRLTQPMSHLQIGSMESDNDDSSSHYGEDDANPANTKEHPTLLEYRRHGMKLRRRQERYGGVRRRNLFCRSKILLTRAWEKQHGDDGGGEDDNPDREALSRQVSLERFGGLQRRNSYKESKRLFEENFDGLKFSEQGTRLFLSHDKGGSNDEKKGVYDLIPRPVRRHRSMDLEPSAKSDVLPGRSMSGLGGRWSYSIRKSRLRSQMARDKLEQAFESYQQGLETLASSDEMPMSSGGYQNGVADAEKTKHLQDSIDVILNSLETSPKPMHSGPALANARKRLQDAFKDHGGQPQFQYEM